MSGRAREASARALVRGAGLWLLVSTAGLLGLWAVALTDSASAATMPSNCTVSGTTVTCSYSAAGTYTFAVPTGVMSLSVTATGAAGGSGLDATSPVGGAGASVTDTQVPVSGGQSLGVVVGGVGGNGTQANGGAGGSPGAGGAGGDFTTGNGDEDGGGGGGFSGLLGASNTPLVIAAGGGGEGGDGGLGGAGDTGGGGAAGGPGSTGGCSGGREAACGGGGGTSSAGGAGGAPGVNNNGISASAGTAGSSLTGGQGGDSDGNSNSSGGGGGGGYFGGGGGGGGYWGGGGGGGSSYGITGLTGEATVSGPAAVTISYKLVTLSGLSVSPHKVSIAGRKVHGKCVKPSKRNAADRSCKRSIKLKVRYTLNTAASVTFTVQRSKGSRKVRAKVVKSGEAGANHFAWKIKGRKLVAGKYKLTASPAGGAPETVTFKVVG